MATAAQVEVQQLLRFLTQDAKVPLSEALPKVGALRKHGLNDLDALVKVAAGVLQEIFPDEKIRKQVENAAKRVTNPKKRARSDTTSTQASKRVRPEDVGAVYNEEQLALPVTDMSTDDLSDIIVETNRAPLVLAFAIVVSKYTLPDQPLSSRLSIAQAVVSANSQSKAKSIGLATGPTAEDEGWAQGQPKVRLMGREVAVLRRYNIVPSTEQDSQETIREQESYETFWGLDLEAMRKSNSPLAAGKLGGSTGPPIHKPQAARAYLLKSMSLSSYSEIGDSTNPKKKKPSPAETAAMKEKAAAMALRAIDLLCMSWSQTLSTDELDRRAWLWYVAVRPSVEQGQAGWGQKGMLLLRDILKLQRDPH